MPVEQCAPSLELTGIAQVCSRLVVLEGSRRVSRAPCTRPISARAHTGVAGTPSLRKGDDRSKTEIVTTYLLRRDRILGNSPAMAEAVGQLKDGQDQLSLRRAALLQAGLQRQVLDDGRIGRCLGQVCDCCFGIGLATPPVPVEKRDMVSLMSWHAVGYD